MSSMCGKMNNLVAVLGILVFYGLFEFGSTILCYECNSAINFHCLEGKLPDSLMKNCSDHDKEGVHHTLCRKIIQHVDYGLHGQLPNSRIIRSCGWDETKYKRACYHRSGYGGRQEVCSCTKDLCNFSDSLVASILLLTALVIIHPLINLC